MESFEYGPHSVVCDLNSGTQTALLSFRAITHGHIKCCAVQNYFNACFNSDSRNALNHLTIFMSLLSMYGHRKIWLSCPASCRISPDELCIISTLEMAQSSASYQLTAHLTWLLGTRPPLPILNAAKNIGEAFSQAGLQIVTPSINDPRTISSDTNAKFKRKVRLKVL